MWWRCNYSEYGNCLKDTLNTSGHSRLVDISHHGVGKIGIL